MPRQSQGDENVRELACFLSVCRSLASERVWKTSTAVHLHGRPSLGASRSPQQKWQQTPTLRAGELHSLWVLMRAPAGRSMSPQAHVGCWVVVVAGRKLQAIEYLCVEAREGCVCVYTVL